MYRVLCGVPKEHCNGMHLITDQVFPTDKCHADHPSAFRCMANYLVKVMGYKRLGTREFLSPEDGGYVRVLTKQSRYGAHLVTGKEQARFMPDKKYAGNRGVIIG